ncbi:methyltransferase type 11 [Shewanella sp. OPT22]|nr:methyltransferase type 11 [Shewanella sp. OPT22]
MHNKPNSWIELPHGELLKQNIEQALSPMLSQSFGYHLLKIGRLSTEINTHHSSIPNQLSLSDKPLAHAICEYTHLPIETSSIDSIVCSLLLEYEANPFKILREINRIQVSGGHLYLIGCNPMSMLSFGKLVPKRKHAYPWNGRFFTSHRVRDWLEVLGYQVVEEKKAIYHPLIGKYSDYSLWQNMLEDWIPQVGSFYILNAKKLECPLTPSKAWKKKRAPNWATAPSAGRVPRLED